MEIRVSLRGFAVAGAVLATGANVPAWADGADKLLPHRAVYDLQLADASDRSGISAMNGRIVYEMTGSKCEGYATRFRFFTDVRTRTKSFTNDQRTTSFESADGESFSFVTQSYLNGQLEEDLRGEATRTADGTSVRITKPQEQELELGRAMFTTQHVAKMIEAARAGETFLTAKVFDGSDGGDALVDTTAVIGKQKDSAGEVAGEGPDIAGNFDGKTVWPISVSYFKAEEDNASERLPVYQVSFLMYESGVARDLKMAYREYSLKADLKQIEFLPQDDCQ